LHPGDEVPKSVIFTNNCRVGQVEQSIAARQLWALLAKMTQSPTLPRKIGPYAYASRQEKLMTGGMFVSEGIKT